MLRCIALVVIFLGTGASAALAKTKVACIGASTTRGSGAPAGQSYPDQLGALLGSEYEVRNFGVSGAGAMRDSSPSYWDSAEFKAATAFAPDIVVDWLGGADSKVANWEPNKAEFLPDYVALIRHFQALPSHPRTIVLVSVVLRDESGVRKTVVENEINPLQRQGAAMTGSAVVEVGMVVAGHPEYFADGVHLKASGYAAVAKAVQAVILMAPPDAGAMTPPDAGVAGDSAPSSDVAQQPDTTIATSPDAGSVAPRPTPDAAKPKPEPEPTPDPDPTPTRSASSGCVYGVSGTTSPLWLLVALFALTRLRRLRGTRPTILK